MTVKIVKRHRPKARKDSSSKNEKPHFGASGNAGSQTMKIDKPKIAAAPKTHPHKTRPTKTRRAK